MTQIVILEDYLDISPSERFCGEYNGYCICKLRHPANTRFPIKNQVTYDGEDDFIRKECVSNRKSSFVNRHSGGLLGHFTIREILR